MAKPTAIIGQVVLYGAFAAFIGYFATNPTYKQIPDDVALIKLPISHLGGRECRKRTPEELAKWCAELEEKTTQGAFLFHVGTVLISAKKQ